jgi:DNA primase
VVSLVAERGRGPCARSAPLLARLALRLKPGAILGLMPGDFDTVKERVDIVQVIGEHGVVLKKSGRGFTGLCPFHSEKTPSFHVNPDTRSYKCFGCSESGDVFTLLEKIDGLTPAEALKTLAERAGVELTSRRDPAEQEREKRLLAANDTAHFYFRQALRGTERGKEVAGYLAERGILPESVDKFGLGYAPDSWDGLVGYLRKKGYSDEEVVAAGLVGRSDRGLFDWFRHRLIVPIKDGRGRIIAFGGRAMRADQRGKYVNSQGTVLFNKSATLYALDAARAAIRKQNAAVIVEGYFDAIALHQAGFENTVASMGTALTEDQYQVLDAMRIERAIVAFDGDAAGQSSAERRGIDLAQQVQRAVRRAGRGSVTARTGLSVYVTVLPTDTDPDVLARRDPEGLRALLGQAMPVLEFVLDRIARRGDLEKADGRRRFLAEALPLVAGEPDPLTRELYLGTLSKLTGLDQEQLRREAAAAPAPAQRPAAVSNETPAKQTAPVERYLMALLIRFPEEAARTDLAPGDLDDPDHRAMFEWLKAGKHPISDLPAHLTAKAAVLGAFAPELEGEVDVAQAIEIAALGLRERNLRRRMKVAQGQLARGNGGDVGAVDGEVAQLANELAELMHRRERHTVLHAADADERDE